MKNLMDILALHDQSEDFWRIILDMLEVGLCMAECDGTLCYMNLSFARMFGFDRESTLGRNICEFFPASELINVMRSGESQKRIRYEYKGLSAFISRYPVEHEGKIVGGLIEVYFRDVKEMQRLLSRIDSLKKKAHYYKQKIQELPGAEYSFEHILGTSRVMQDLRLLGRKFSLSNLPVLITGESGTGKEMVAHAVHAASQRADEVFIRVNCAAIPSELIESELFGYEEGSFTGAQSGGKVGKFELADRGTIFLDEIGEVPLSVQPKLLRVLEHGEIQKIGKSQPVFSNFRLVAATNRNLPEMVAQERFRSDLYHRLSILQLQVPSMRERPEDIPILTGHFIRHIEGGLLRGSLRIAPAVFELFRQYDWPGNIRELKNVLTFALFSLEEGCDMIRPHHLPPHFLGKVRLPREAAGSSLQKTRDQASREAICAALQRCRGNKSKTALELGISRMELYNKLKKLNISYIPNS